MALDIPLGRWQPLTVPEVTRLFAGAPFSWGLAGGYAIEQFVGKSLRDHGDIDILICRDDQLALQAWLQRDWRLYKADPPGSLQVWQPGEYLARGIHDVWAHGTQSQSWELQIMFIETSGNRWFSRRNERICGDRNDLIILYEGIPCIRVEVQLLFKSKNCRPKDHLDFQACLPKMDEAAKHWLLEKLQVLYTEGHPWQDLLRPLIRGPINS